MSITGINFCHFDRLNDRISTVFLSQPKDSTRKSAAVGVLRQAQHPQSQMVGEWLGFALQPRSRTNRNSSNPNPKQQTSDIRCFDFHKIIYFEYFERRHRYDREPYQRHREGY